MLKALTKYLFLCSLLLLGFENSVLAEGYHPFLNSQTVIVYKHWNVKKKKITGYSRMSYNQVVESGKEYLVETHEDSKPSGKVYLRKKLWFEQDRGRLIRYWQEDLRKNWRIENLYNNQTITTTLDQNGQITKMKQAMGVDIIPFELLTFFLRKQFAEHYFENEIPFTLYIPASKFQSELLSATWEFVAMKEKELEMNTPLGKVPAVQILVTTTSALIKMLLPESKTKYRFVLAQQMPHHILAFEESETQFILETLKTENHER